MAFETPIAFCIFNRPEPTSRVFEAIARQRPSKLLIIADGPRDDRPKEDFLVAQTRAIVEKVDWNCDLITNLSDSNLGCRNRMATGLTWAFEQVEELIILEDDCLPDDSFFEYCQTLLRMYRDRPEVMMISGNNFQPKSRTNHSYFFSNYSHIWGWASWRRAWQQYDVDMQDWPQVRAEKCIAEHLDSQREYEFWRDIFDQQHANAIDTWDFAWAYTCMKQGGLTILPNVNLVSNLGFGADATHTMDINSPLSNLPTESISRLEHPETIERNNIADQWTFQNIFCPTAPKSPVEKKPRFISRLFNPWRKSA